MALLYLLNLVQEQFHFSLHVGHVNHGLRGLSDADAKFVESQCVQWGIPFHGMKLDPSTKVRKKSPEAWAREERYKVLRDLLKTVNGDCIVTAHHANDQAETILFRLQQKSGLDGLRGIHEKQGEIIRPLLRFNRNEIDSYIRENSIPYVEDETNVDTSFPRNFIRHQILKPWDEKDPYFIDSLVTISQESDQLVRFMNQITSEFISSNVRCQNAGNYVIQCNSLSSLPDLIQSRVIKTLAGYSVTPWRKYQWKDLSRFLISAGTGDILTLQSGFRLLRDRDNWILSNQKFSFGKTLMNPGESIQVNDVCFEWDWTSAKREFSKNPMTEIIDGSLLKDNAAILRHWRSGDRFQPYGMKHSKKLSDFLTDEKINRFDKENQLVLEVGNDIIWVCGLRISNQVKVTRQSQAFVSLTMGFSEV